MAGDNSVIIPLLDSLGRLSEGRAILTSSCVPDESSLPFHFTSGVHDSAEKLGQEAGAGILARLRILFGGRQVEDQVGLDHRSRGFVEKDKFFVGMRMEVFVGELLVEFGSDVDVKLVLRREDVVEFDPLGGGICLSLFRETLHANDFRLRVLFGPGGDENMMFNVRRNDILDGTHGLHLALDIRCECDGGEDRHVSCRQFDQCPAATKFDVAEPEERNAEGRDRRGYVPDNHDLCGVRGDQGCGGF